MFIDVVLSIFIVVMVIMAVMALKGRAVYWIAGFDKYDEAERNKYDQRSLGYFTAGYILLSCVPAIVLILTSANDIGWLFTILILFMMVIPVIGKVYAKKSQMFLKKEMTER